MPKFYLRKLVRDKVLEETLKDPLIDIDYRVLEGEEFVCELIHKAIEEASEIPTSSDADLDDVLSELADLQTVVDEIRKYFKFSEGELREKIAQKLDKRGGFSGRYYVESETVKDGSPWVKYYRAEPDRFPEE